MSIWCWYYVLENDIKPSKVILNVDCKNRVICYRLLPSEVSKVNLDMGAIRDLTGDSVLNE